MTREGKLRIETAASAFLAAYWLVNHIDASNRLAVERDRQKREERDRRKQAIEDSFEQARNEERERFREDVAAGVATAMRSED